jgi:alkylation response protein AidB-like acyl-CoA dehydrogenase
VTTVETSAAGHDEQRLAAVLDVISRSGAALAREAARADRTATFPEHNIEWMRRHGLLAAGIPIEYGGHGLGTAPPRASSTSSRP